ncbi:hypothetical protein QYM36_010697 [Artemia franciscana]|uniref:Ubiquitin carboxyl-terminal hydrolase 14 n=2 Tax=Artemia franciscana TaxID=6661 RepID=A0AA88I155_ARTSF|nr:hypothetical protein QYM36_010697 [Artemia franciscana]
MPVYSVNLKWFKKLYHNLKLNTDKQPWAFKRQLFTITGVIPERQKVIMKGKKLKDYTWHGFDIKDGVTLTLVGTGEENILAEPWENQMAMTYITATLHLLLTITDLFECIFYNEIDIAWSGSVRKIVDILMNQFNFFNVNHYTDPAELIEHVIGEFPRLDEEGMFVRQDANEFLLRVLSALKQGLSPLQVRNQPTNYSSFIDQFLGVFFSCKISNLEDQHEPVSYAIEGFFQLNCIISSEVNSLEDGIRLTLKEEIIQCSQITGRDAVYEKRYEISRLPSYLFIKMERFSKKKGKSEYVKNYKDVQLPVQLDVNEFCSEELKSNLMPMRRKLENNIENIKNKRVSEEEITWFLNDIGSNNSGYYELKAVLIHHGESLSNGYYEVWLKRGNKWLQYDTNFYAETEYILELCRGTKESCAYILLYGSTKIIKS